MFAVLSGVSFGFATMKVDPLCAACQISVEQGAGLIANGDGTDNALFTNSPIFKTCTSTVFKECLQKNAKAPFCESVVSEAKRVLGATMSKDFGYEEVLKCVPFAPTSTLRSLTHARGMRTCEARIGGVRGMCMCEARQVCEACARARHVHVHVTPPSPHSLSTL